jgi:hypothetical protein
LANSFFFFLIVGQWCKAKTVLLAHDTSRPGQGGLEKDAVWWGVLLCGRGTSVLSVADRKNLRALFHLQPSHFNATYM